MLLTTVLIIFYFSSALNPLSAFLSALYAGGSPRRLSLPGFFLADSRLGSDGDWQSGEERGWGIPSLLLSALVTSLLETACIRDYSSVE